MATVYDLARNFRRDVDAGSDAAIDRLLSGYARTWRELQPRIIALAEEIDAAREAGTPTIVPRVAGGQSAPDLGAISADKARQLRRLREIERETLERVAAIAREMGTVIPREQMALIAAAQEHAAALTAAAVTQTTPGLVATFNAVNLAAIETQIAMLADGTPLTRLLARLGPEAASKVSSSLITGISLGRNPNRVAAGVREALGGNAARARNIARTEMARSYRESSAAFYEANSDVVDGWIWLSAAQPRTCAACWAMHGSEHPSSETLQSHPQCRCTMVPKTKTWAQLGFPAVPDRSPKVRPGADAFDDLPRDAKLAVLGPQKLEAFEAGDIQLGDLVKTTKHPDWGTSRSVASLEAAKRRARRRAR